MSHIERIVLVRYLSVLCSLLFICISWTAVVLDLSHSSSTSPRPRYVPIAIHFTSELGLP